MFKIVTRLGALVVLAALASAPSLAADVPDVPPGATELHLVQSATRTMTPDRIRVTLRADARGSDVRLVQAEINKLMAKALDKAKSVAAVKAETGGYSVYRDFDSKNRQPWHASQTVSMVSADFAAALALAGDLQDLGMPMSGMQFTLAPETLKATESELTSSALASLRTRADEVAKALGTAVDHYKTLTISNASAPVQGSREFFMAGASALAAAPAPPPVAQSGDATVSLTVNADIILAPSKP
ncbi:MAG TPA: SIMPL domain-containing protein [Stellaceae bacterium]|nr:SIMPL domain-containing protein [Stellaceae bacterium]